VFGKSRAVVIEGEEREGGGEGGGGGEQYPIIRRGPSEYSTEVMVRVRDRGGANKIWDVFVCVGVRACACVREGER